MQSILDSVRSVLDRDPSPALPLTELHRHLVRERSGPVPGPASLLERLRGRPDLVRIVEPWDGAWRLLSENDGGYRKSLECAGLALEPWIAPAVGGRARTDAPPACLRERLRVGLHHLGGFLDLGSRTAQLRWVAMVRQARRTGARLRNGGSGPGGSRAPAQS